MREREQKREWKRERKKKENLWTKESESERESKIENQCVCVCVRERERERENESANILLFRVRKLVSNTLVLASKCRYYTHHRQKSNTLIQGRAFLNLKPRSQSIYKWSCYLWCKLCSQIKCTDTILWSELEISIHTLINLWFLMGTILILQEMCTRVGQVRRFHWFYSNLTLIGLFNKAEVNLFFFRQWCGFK